MVFPMLGKKGVRAARERFKKKKIKETKRITLPFKILGQPILWRPKKPPNILIAALAGMVGAWAYQYHSANTLDKRPWEERIVVEHGDIEEVAPSLWTVKAPFWGFKDLRTMTIYRLNSGGLFLHNAIAVNEETRIKIESLGPPEIIAIPSAVLLSDSLAYKEKYPQAKLVGPNSVVDKYGEGIRLDASTEEIFSKENKYGVKLHKPPLKDYYQEYIFDVPLEDGKRALIISEVLLNVDGNTKRSLWFTVLDSVYGICGDGSQPKMSLGYRKWASSDNKDLRIFWAKMADYVKKTNQTDHPIKLATVVHSKEITGDLESKLRVLQRSL